MADDVPIRLKVQLWHAGVCHEDEILVRSGDTIEVDLDGSSKPLLREVLDRPLPDDRVAELEATLEAIMADYDGRMATRRGRLLVWLAHRWSPRG